MPPPLVPVAGSSKPSRNNGRLSRSNSDKRKAYSHTTVNVMSCARHELIAMARLLSIKSDGDTEVLSQRVQDELKYHPYEWIKNQSVFKSALKQSKSSATKDLPISPPSAYLGPSPLLMRELRSSVIDTVSHSRAISEAFEDSSSVEDEDMLDSSQPWSSEELHLTVMGLLKSQKETKKILVMHSKGIASCASGISKMTEATNANAAEHSALRKAISEMEQAVATVTVDYANEITSVRASVSAVETKVESSNLTAGRAQTAVLDLSEKVTINENSLSAVASMQEISERARRSQNVLVYGWPVVSSPMADAVEFLSLINYKQHEYITARRYNPPRRFGLSMSSDDRPPILNITFPAVKHARDAMATYRSHSGGTRSLPYWVKPDLTRSQLDAKRYADEGIRHLLERNPHGIYRERNGRIAEYRRVGDSNELVFDKFLPDPLVNRSSLFGANSDVPAPQRAPSGSSVRKRPRTELSTSSGVRSLSDREDSDVERSSRPTSSRRGYRDFSNAVPFFATPSGYSGVPSPHNKSTAARSGGTGESSRSHQSPTHRHRSSSPVRDGNTSATSHAFSSSAPTNTAASPVAADTAIPPLTDAAASSSESADVLMRL